MEVKAFYSLVSPFVAVEVGEVIHARPITSPATFPPAEDFFGLNLNHIPQGVLRVEVGVRVVRVVFHNLKIFRCHLQTSLAF